MYMNICKIMFMVKWGYAYFTAQKTKFSIKDFFSKCVQIRKKVRIWLHLLKKSLMEKFIFSAVFGLLYLKFWECREKKIVFLFLPPSHRT